MDGDSSTTDASQLGISGEYMASGHYVLQSQDGEEQAESVARQRAAATVVFLARGLKLPILICVFCLFAPDDGEENLNDHDDGGIKENFREQDIYLPIANVARIMKNAVPQTGKVGLKISSSQMSSKGSVKKKIS